MPPPKVKLHKNSGKARPGPPKITQLNENLRSSNSIESQPSTSLHSSNASPAGPALTIEQEEQFQAELYWCIQQLQKALAMGKLTNKQIEEHTKSLNTLMSNSAPIIKKRQVMRLSFGDYRSKMGEEEKKARKVTIKLGSSKPSDKSVFLKKAFSNTGENNFKFNFPSPEKDSLFVIPETEEIKIIESEPSVISSIKSITFQKSDNSFRFNFSSDIQNGNVS